MKRYEMAAQVVASIREANPEWNRNPMEIPGAVADWLQRLPGVPMVDDGPTPAGRGTTAFDLVRRVETSVVRFDWLSIKTGKIGMDKKLPSKVHLCTGTPDLHRRLIENYTSGANLPTLIFAARKGEEHGKALLINLAEAIRTYGVVPIEDYPESGWERGKAPPVYFKWSSVRPSGIRRAEVLREMGVPDDGRPHYHRGCLWTLDSVQYPEMVVSLYALGIDRRKWIDVHMSDLADLLDDPEQGFAWDTLYRGQGK